MKLNGKPVNKVVKEDNSKVAMRRVLKEAIDELCSAIDICFKKELFAPGLILLYSSIDVMAWLNRKTAHKDVKQSDFLKWVKDYVLPNLKTRCNPIDLYAARCSFVHSYTAQSKLSREGKAKEIGYAWGPERARELQFVFDQTSKKGIIILDIGELFAALRKGMQDFIVAIQADPDWFKIVNERALKFFGKIRPRDYAKKIMGLK
jgi:hypothetical protein